MMKLLKMLPLLVFSFVLPFTVPVSSAGIPDLAQIKAMAAAQVRIERLRKQKKPDWQEITSQYEILAPLVKATDRNRNLNYDRDIRQALAQCAAGKKAKVNQQVLAKGLQHVVVLNIRDELKTLKRSPDAAKRIAAYFEGIRPTFTRRDKDFYGGRKTLEASAEAAITQLAHGKRAPLTARRELADAIDRTYALCVLYEIQAVEHLRATNRAECEVKLKEAEIFYRIIQPRIARTSAAADARITGVLKADFDRMDAAFLEANLNKGLKGITLR
jgi:hypothetical protein